MIYHTTALQKERKQERKKRKRTSVPIKSLPYLAT
jgi:hypothetical protein